MKLYEMTVRELCREEIEALSPERRARAARFRFEKDRLLCLAAGVLLDRGLREYGLRERGVEISRGEHGKPFLPQYPEICFNLTHSGERAAAVFSDRAVGCDLERLRAVNWRLVESRFCPEEQALLRQSEWPERDFCRLWTCRESFLKALGTGLTLPLSSVCVELSPDAARLRQTADPRQWRLTEYFSEEYCLAICEES